MCVCLFVCVHMCMYVCMCIYIYIVPCHIISFRIVSYHIILHLLISYMIYATHIDYKHQSSIYFHHISIISPLLNLGWTFGLLFASAFWEDVAFIWLLNGYLSIYLSTCLPTYLSIHPSIYLSVYLSLSIYIFPWLGRYSIGFVGEIFDLYLGRFMILWFWGDQ